MSKLHEILAVETGLAETANRITKEVTKTLGNKQDLFTGLVKKHEIFDDSRQDLVQATEHKEISSTVDEQLDFLGGELVKYWDAVLQKESANQNAKADIVIDGNVIASDVPAIVLLGMEKKLASLLTTYNAIPTLDAARAWELDPAAPKPGIYRTKYDTERQQTVTTKEYIQIAPATERHQAQMVEQGKIEIIGKYVQTDFSSAISSHEKAAKLTRLTTLIRAVKKARQRANDVEINPELKFGSALLDYVNGV